MDSAAIPQQQAAEAAKFLRSLGNEHRLQILCRLAAGPMSVGELIEPFNVSASALSQHLAVLRKQGLVDYNKQAQTLNYFIADKDTLNFITLLKDKFCPDL